MAAALDLSGGATVVEANTELRLPGRQPGAAGAQGLLDLAVLRVLRSGIQGLEPGLQALNASSLPRSQRFYQQRERSRWLAPARIIEMVAGEWRTPIVQDSHQRPVTKAGRHLVLHNEAQPKAFLGGPGDHLDVVESQLSVHPDPQRPLILLQFPGIEAATAYQPQIDAPMARKVMRGMGHAMLGEVVRRAHHGHAQVRADPHRHHVLVERLAEPDTGIKALGDDVRETGIDAHLDMHVRILGQQPGQPWPQDRVDSVLRRGDPQIAGRTVAQRRDGGQLLVDARERRSAC